MAATTRFRAVACGFSRTDAMPGPGRRSPSRRITGCTSNDRMDGKLHVARVDSPPAKDAERRQSGTGFSRYTLTTFHRRIQYKS
jgi:hypothetical protein